MTDKKPKPDSEKLILGYKKMLKRAHDTVTEWEDNIKPKLKEQLDVARQKSVEYGELSEDESKKIAEYLERDLRDAAEFIVDAEDIINEKLTIDMMFAEEKIAKLLLHLADKTTLEYLELQNELAHHFSYHTGEIVGHGALACDDCEQIMKFTDISQIPPCPKCHHTQFHRVNSVVE